MAVTKPQARKVRQPVLIGDMHVTKVLDGTNTVEIIELSSVAEKFTVQSSDTLDGSLEVSVNGVDYVGIGNFFAGTLVSYNSHLIMKVKVTRTAGSGKLSLVAR
jgi:hypothetical protein